MNIDINTLLNGMGRKQASQASAEATGFGQSFEQKLAGLAAELPPLEGERLSPGEAITLMPVPDTETPELGEESELLVEPEESAAIPPAVTLLPIVAENRPDWQLQQIVTRNDGARASEAVPTDSKSGSQGRMLQPGFSTQPLSATDEKNLQIMLPQFAVTEKQSHKAVQLPAVAAKMAESSSPSPLEINVPRAAMAMPADFTSRIAATQSAPATMVNPHTAGTAAWQETLGQQLTIFTRNGMQNAEIKLHPEELGALQISVRVQQDKAQLHIISEHPHVRQALEAALPQLRTAMAESGIQLGQSSVSADTPQSAGTQGNGQRESAGEERGTDDQHVNAEEENSLQNLTLSVAGAYGINTFA